MAKIDDYDDIKKVIDLAMEGASTGNPEKILAAFDSRAWVFGSAEGTRHDMTIQAFADLCKEAPLNRDGRYRVRVVSITQHGDAAQAVIVEDYCWGSVEFVDFFNLAFIDGAWKVTNKTFAVTGGTLPDDIRNG